MAAPAFELDGISKRFGAVVANDGVDLSVEAGEIRGLVGENGAGKTTLMGVLYGIHRPDAGEIRIAGRTRRFDSPLDAIAAGLGMVHQHFMLFDSLTVAENVVFGSEPVRRGLFDPGAATRAVAELADRYGLDVDPRARVGSLAVGVRQRVEILKALYRTASILILDEPTAVLTPGEQRGLFEVLRRLATEGAAVVFITHKLREVMELTDRVTVLRRGRVAGSRRTSETTAEELSGLMVGGAPEASPGSGTMGPPPPGSAAGAPRDQLVLEVEALEVAGRRGGSAVAVDLSVRAGEIVGVAGVAGNGQSELVEAIVGLGAASAGRIVIAGHDLTRGSVAERRRAGLAWVPEDRDGAGLALAASVAENLLMGFENDPTLAPRGLLDRAAVAHRARGLVEAWGVRPAGVETRAAALSGGNRQKLVVARELTGRARLLVVEQPTRGVDLASIERIHRALVDYRAAGGAALVVSSELTELLALADRIVVMLGGRVVGELPRAAASEERLGLMMAGAA